VEGARLGDGWGGAAPRWGGRISTRGVVGATPAQLGRLGSRPCNCSKLDWADANRVPEPSGRGRRPAPLWQARAINQLAKRLINCIGTYRRCPYAGFGRGPNDPTVVGAAHHCPTGPHACTVPSWPRNVMLVDIGPHQLSQLLVVGRDHRRPWHGTRPTLLQSSPAGRPVPQRWTGNRLEGRHAAGGCGRRQTNQPYTPMVDV
jgi:hypothetical protein